MQSTGYHKKKKRVEQLHSSNVGDVISKNYF